MNNLPTIASEIGGANPFLENILDNQQNTSKINENLIEKSKKVKVVAEYNVEKGKFHIADEDMGILAAYDVDRERLRETLERIERDISLRPFEFEQPTWRWLGLKFLSVLF